MRTLHPLKNEMKYKSLLVEEFNYQFKKIKIMRKILNVVKVKFEANTYLAEASGEFRQHVLVKKYKITKEELTEIIIEDLTKTFELKGEVISLEYNRSVGLIYLKLKDGGSIRCTGGEKNFIGAIKGDLFSMTPIDQEDRITLRFKCNQMSISWVKSFENKVIRYLSNRYGLIPISIDDQHMLGFILEYHKVDLKRAAFDSSYLGLNVDIRMGILYAERLTNESFKIVRDSEIETLHNRGELNVNF